MNESTKPQIAFTLDFETGGLDCQTCACTQIAIHATRIDTFEKVGSYVRYIAPYDKREVKALASTKKVLRSKFDQHISTPMEYQERALEYSAITMSMLENMGESIDEVANGAIEFMKEYAGGGRRTKPFLIGQNIEFDKGFLMQMMEYAGLVGELSKILRGTKDFYGHWQPTVLDTIILGQLAMAHDSSITSYKLEIMCDNLGIELDDAHDADADVAATTGVVAVLSQRMRNVSADGSMLAKQKKTRDHFKI